MVELDYQSGARLTIAQGTAKLHMTFWAIVDYLLAIFATVVAVGSLVMFLQDYREFEPSLWEASLGIFFFILGPAAYATVLVYWGNVCVRGRHAIIKHDVAGFTRCRRWCRRALIPAITIFLWPLALFVCCVAEHDDFMLYVVLVGLILCAVPLSLVLWTLRVLDRVEIVSGCAC